MNLELAILNVLMGAGRAIPATRIPGFLSAFIGGEHTLGDIEAALRRMETAREVTGTFNKDRGTLWKETDDGRIRVLNSQ